MFDYVAGTFSWTYRVFGYVYLLTDHYPPFSLGDEPDYPIGIEIEYPEQVDRWRPLVHWLLILPYAFVAALLLQVAGIVAFIGVFVILFTAKLPEGMFNLIVNPLRWHAAGERLPRLDGHPLPAVRLGGVSRHRTGRRNCQPRADQPEARRGATRPAP